MFACSRPFISLLLASRRFAFRISLVRHLHRSQLCLCLLPLGFSFRVLFLLLRCTFEFPLALIASYVFLVFSLLLQLIGISFSKGGKTSTFFGLGGIDGVERGLINHRRGLELGIMGRAVILPFFAFERLHGEGQTTLAALETLLVENELVDFVFLHFKHLLVTDGTVNSSYLLSSHCSFHGSKADLVALIILRTGLI